MLIWKRCKPRSIIINFSRRKNVARKETHIEKRLSQRDNHWSSWGCRNNDPGWLCAKGSWCGRSSILWIRCCWLYSHHKYCCWSWSNTPGLSQSAGLWLPSEYHRFQNTVFAADDWPAYPQPSYGQVCSRISYVPRWTNRWVARVPYSICQRWCWAFVGWRRYCWVYGAREWRTNPSRNLRIWQETRSRMCQIRCQAWFSVGRDGKNPSGWHDTWRYCRSTGS